MMLLLKTPSLKQKPPLGDEVHPFMSLRAAGEPISSFLVRRLPRRPIGLFAMTDMGRVLAQKLSFRAKREIPVMNLLRAPSIE